MKSLFTHSIMCLRNIFIPSVNWPFNSIRTHLTCIGSDFCPTATCKPKAGLVVCSLALCLLKGASGQEGGSPGNPQGQRGSMLRRKEKVCGNNFGAHGFPLLFSVPWKQRYLHLFFSPTCSLLRFSPFPSIVICVYCSFLAFQARRLLS